MNRKRTRKNARGSISAEPGVALFRRLRVHLTLWYSGVLASALLLFSIALYLGAQYLLFNPIQNNLRRQAATISLTWQQNPSRTCTPLPGGGPPPPLFIDRSNFPFMISCYDPNGQTAQSNGYTLLPEAFLTNSLANTSLRSGESATDIVDGGGLYGHIYRYAQVVRDQTGNITLGVIQVGMSVATQENTLTILLTLLLIVGAVTLLGAGLGGLFLANRALVPARLAFSRQQRFIADAAHELRTPLTLLSADAEVLLESRDRLDPDDALLLEDIFTEAGHMSTLATNMLTLARLDSGEQYNHREHDVVQLSDLAEHVVRRASALAEQQSTTLHTETTQPATVIGDPVLLEQALLILLDNAIKYNKLGGSVTVRTTGRDGQAFVEVCDTGIGIAREHLTHLGERFYRVDKARTRTSGGRGLGLSIAHAIARAHSGILTIASSPERGTTATLAFPAIDISPHNATK